MVSVTVNGSGFAAGTSLSVGTGITVSNLTVGSPTQLTATLTIGSGAALAARNVTVTNPGGGSGTLTEVVYGGGGVRHGQLRGTESGGTRRDGTGDDYRVWVYARGNAERWSGYHGVEPGGGVRGEAHRDADNRQRRGAGDRNTTVTNSGGGNGTLPGGFTVATTVTRRVGDADPGLQRQAARPRGARRDGPGTRRGPGRDADSDAERERGPDGDGAPADQQLGLLARDLAHG